MSPPYVVPFDTRPYPDGSAVTLMATIDDLAGHCTVDTAEFTL